MAPLRFALLQARNANDPARTDEHAAFAARLKVGIDQITAVDVLSTKLDEKLYERCDAILVGGSGEYSVLDSHSAIIRFVDFLAKAAAEGPIPIFASCFGFQAIVLGLGGTVVADEANAEVGSYPIHLTKEGQTDALYSEFPKTFIGQLGHKDRADTLPNCLESLAYSARAPYQAIRYRGRPVYATQFHPELTGNDNRQRFLGYMEQYGRLFGKQEAQNRLDSHVDSPEANSLLGRFSDHFLGPAGAGQ